MEEYSYIFTSSKIKQWSNAYGILNGVSPFASSHANTISLLPPNLLRKTNPRPAFPWFWKVNSWQNDTPTTFVGCLVDIWSMHQAIEKIHKSLPVELFVHTYCRDACLPLTASHWPLSELLNLRLSKRHCKIPSIFTLPYHG